MLLLVSSVKLIAEIAILAMVGQWLLGLLAGRRRQENFFYRLLQVLTDPFVKVVRAITPRIVLDRHIPLATLLLMLAVWLAASLVFALLTAALQVVAGLRPFEPLAGAAGAAALAAAGAYQFTDLKDACLRKCRNPFGVLFSRWTAKPSGILRLGAEQGAWCLGCCWALMLVMFVVGTGNLGWMLALGLVMAAEKNLAWGRRLGAPLGALLLAASGATVGLHAA